MALSIEKIKEIRERDKQSLNNIFNDAETIKAQAMDKIRKEHNALMEQIQSLMDEKAEILRSPMSKIELMEIVKEELKKCREEALSILRAHLESCHKGHSTPFSALAIKWEFSEEKAYRLLWLFINEKDIKALVDSLPEIGIPAIERDTKISCIDEKIATLTATINKTQ